ncbi:MAG: metallophosphoesterase [Bacteroidota bacterium]
MNRRLYIWTWKKWLPAFMALLTFSLTACEQEFPTPIDYRIHVPYKFWVAGHIYGHPNTASDDLRPHPPLLEHFDDLNADPEMEFAVFTGDMIKWNVPRRWDTLEKYLGALDHPWYAVPGNHDTDAGTEPLLWLSRVGARYQWFIEHGDLFIFLDSNKDNWRITDDQWAMFAEALAQRKNIHNIFIFVHNVLWWDPDPDGLHHAAQPNFAGHRADTLNFWTEMVPRLKNYPLQVPTYVFAGDAGAWCGSKPISYYQEDSLHLITSGIGCSTTSHYLIVEVPESKQVQIDIVEVGDIGPDHLGKLEDWKYPN